MDFGDIIQPRECIRKSKHGPKCLAITFDPGIHVKSTKGSHYITVCRRCTRIMFVVDLRDCSMDSSFIMPEMSSFFHLNKNLVDE